MRYYYVVDPSRKHIAESMNKDMTDDIDERIKLYIEDNGSTSLNYDKLTLLSNELEVPFCDLLLAVFSEYISIENTFRKIFHLKDHTLKRFRDNEKDLISYIDYDYPEAIPYINYIKDIFQSITDYKFIDEKLSLLRTVGQEFDTSFFSENDYFQKRRKKNADTSSRSILILLNVKQEYIGHIYLSSWIRSRPIFNDDDINTLTFIGIRTSVKNLLTSEDKYIAASFITAIKQWGYKYGWTSLQVSASPIGTMRDHIKRCGFNNNYAIKIEDIKCNSSEQMVELDVHCGMYPVDYIFNLVRQLDRYTELIRSLWIDPRIVYNICNLLLRSYSEIEITDLIIIDTYKLILENKPGYWPFDDFKIGNISTVKSFYQGVEALNYFPRKDDLINELDTVDILTFFKEELPQQLINFDNYCKQLKNTYLVTHMPLDRKGRYYMSAELKNNLDIFLTLSSNIELFIKWVEMSKSVLEYTGDLRDVQAEMADIQVCLNSLHFYHSYKEEFKSALNKTKRQVSDYKLRDILQNYEKKM